MAGGTPEGTILRSMGGDMAEAIEEKTGYNLRAVTDPEALFIIEALRRTARKMYPDQGTGEEKRIHPKRKIVIDQLRQCESELRAEQFMDWQHRLHQDLSVMSLGIGNIDDAVSLDDVMAPDLDGFQDLEEENTEDE